MLKSLLKAKYLGEVYMCIRVIPRRQVKLKDKKLMFIIQDVLKVSKLFSKMITNQVKYS